MSRADYVVRSLAKAASKRWEHYVIGRIIHRLNDPEIEFICQQAVRRPDGNGIYLADLFFPQLEMYLEVDEGQHSQEKHTLRDVRREADIVNATGFKEHRITVYDLGPSERKLDELDRRVDEYIEQLRAAKQTLQASGEFKAWDYERRYSPERHIEQGTMEVGPYTAFRYHRDALRCFGYLKGHYQKAVWNLPPEVVKELGGEGKWCVWFPKLYDQPKWENSLSEDGTVIVEKPKFTDQLQAEPWDRRVVFAHSKDSLNRTLYRFLGVFKLDANDMPRGGKTFVRTNDRVKTINASS